MFETITSIINDHVYDEARRTLASAEIKEATDAVKFLLSIVSKDTAGNCVICHGYFHHGTLHKHRSDCALGIIEKSIKRNKE